MEKNNHEAEGRREYGHSSDRKYSTNGRVLRPRRNAGSSSDEHHSFGGGERRSYGEHRSYNGDGERRSYGERRSNFSSSDNGGERRGYGERRNYSGDGEHRNFGDGERRSYGGHKSYGERRSNFSGNGNGGERRSYGEHRNYGGGERKSYGEGERRSYSEHRSYGDNERRNGGERRSFNGGERRSYGRPGEGRGNYQKGRKPYRKEDAFLDNDESGIDKMISRRPQVQNLDSDFDSAPALTKDEIRLNKFIANSGVCSRREADTLIQAGVVTVNGEVVTELGTKVNVLTDEVKFNGERLKGEEKVYVVMNKPKGFVTTASDPHAEKTVMDLLKGCQGRIFPVGRLDKATTGVLMFTNDGEIAERLTHPSYDKKKIYQVLVDHDLTQEDYEKILSGITLSDGPIKADELEYIDENDHRKLGIEIHSGKNRIVRRIFESLGYDVRALDRVYFAGLTKKGLQRGEWRYLSEGEVNILKMGAYV